MNTLSAKNLLIGVLRNGGVSLNLEGNSPTKGYMVSLSPYENRISKEIVVEEAIKIINDYIQKHRDFVQKHSLYFGMWETDGELVLDISQNIEDKVSAVSLGMLRDQQAIYDIVNGKDINLPSRQKSGTFTQQNTYLSMKVREICEVN